MTKFKASDVIVIDDLFIDKLANKLSKKMNESDTYNVDQVAEICNVTPQTIRNHITAGLIKAFKPGKSHVITKESLNEYINR